MHMHKSLKNKSRSTFNDRFIAAVTTPRIIALFVCFLRRFYRFLRLCASPFVQRPRVVCKTQILQPAHSQSAMIYFAIAISKSPLHRAILRSYLFFYLCLSRVTSRLITSTIGRSCHDRHVRSRFRIFFLSSLSRISANTLLHARKHPAIFFIALLAIVKTAFGKTCVLRCARRIILR